MTRPHRFLSIVNSSSSTTETIAAEAPEAVAIESDFVVILAALLCALICVVGLIAIARCAWLRRRGSTDNNVTGTRSAAAKNKGLKKKVLQSLPKFIYDQKLGNIAGGGGSECAICLTEYVNGDEIRVLPQCGHGFHVVCIDTWLGSHSSCPSCRQILVVARCRKCGECPVVSGASSSSVRMEADLKAREDRGSSSTAGFLPF